MAGRGGSAGRVSVIVPTRDPGERIRTLIGGLERTAWPDLEVIIVDNGSRDPASLAFMDKAHATIVRRDIPFNFSRLVNSGAARATGEYLLLLNDDVEIEDPEWLAAMVECSHRPGVGPVGALLLYPDGPVQHCGIELADGAPAHTAVGETIEQVTALGALETGPRWAVTGACMLVRRELFERLAGFETLMHTNYNDVDFCLRARQIGAFPYLAADARLIHHESATRGKKITPEIQADWLMFRTRWAHELQTAPGA